MTTPANKRQMWLKDSLITLLLTRAAVAAFIYEPATEHIQCYFVDEHGKRQLVESDDGRGYIAGKLLSGGVDNEQSIDEAFQLFLSQPRGQRDSMMSLWQKPARWYRCSWQRMTNDGETFVFGCVDDVHDEKVARQHLLSTLTQDRVTHLYDAVSTQELVSAAIDNLQPGEKGVVMLLDLDDFHLINEQAGTIGGDNCLRNVADALSKDFRENDIFGRLEGDSFAIYFCGVFSIDVIERRVQHIVDVFANISTGTSLQLTCSIGVAVVSSRHESYSALLKKASAALKEAKARGKNRYRMYDGERF